MENHVMHKFLSIGFLFHVQLMVTMGDSRCSKDLNTCKPGHQLSVCPTGSDFGNYCEECTSKTFQPDTNTLGDRCRFRQACDGIYTRYRHKGSTTKDADCMCEPGYHFENEDQRACVLNIECGVGFGQGDFGVCENCLEKGGYSDVKDRKQPCLALTRCSLQNRCLLKASDGTKNNECSSSVVEDTTQCNQTGTREGIIIGCVLGILLLFLIAMTIFLYKRFYRRRHKPWLNGEKTDDVIRVLVEMSRKDPNFTRNVLEKSCAVVEDKIPRQEWALATELFKGHHDCAKYEDLLEKSQGQNQREATRAYLEEWRKWKGDNSESIAILFQCLRKCDRDDIVVMICKQFRHDADMEMNANSTTNSPPSKYNLCLWKRSQNRHETEPNEESKPLHSTPDVINMYPALNTPSAPVTEDSYTVVQGSDLNYPVQVSNT